MGESHLAVPRRASALGWLREARWLDRERARAYARVFLFATVLVAVARVALALLGVSPLGIPLHADYVSFWSAGRLALAGQPAAAYDVARHWAVQRGVFAGFGYEAFFYPPVFLLLCAPLALLPFWLSFAGFLGLTLFGYWRTLSRLLPGASVALLGFPAVAVNLIYGQNAFLTASLFAAALLWLRRRPVLAGICFGCLCYKPHLGMTVPVALLAAGEWRALFAAAGTVAALVGASVAAFGLGTWRAFLAGAALARHSLEAGLTNNMGWESTFRAVVQAGGGVATAYAVQAVVSLGAVAALAIACRRRPASLAGVLPPAALLTTPFLLAYDLTVLAVPLAWVVAQARRTGFLPWEKAVLAFVYVVPLLSLFGGRYGLPLGPPAMLALFAVALRRAWRMPPG